MVSPLNAKALQEITCKKYSLVADAELFDFVVVILAVQNVPFLAAFYNRALLALDFLPCGLVNAFFVVEQLLQYFADLQPERIAVFHKFHFIHICKSVGNDMSGFIDLIAA